MKRIVYTLVCLTLSMQLIAQTSGGPDAYGYTWKNSNHNLNPPVYGWFDITGIGVEVAGLTDDNIVGPFTACSGFQFYWYPTPQFWIGSNGYIAFNNYNNASPFPTGIPLTTGGNDFIAPLMADLNFAGTLNPAKCYYYYNIDTLVVSFIDVPFWTNLTANYYTGTNSFQIILNKVDKSITFNYLVTNMGILTSIDCAVGIENVTGTLGLQTMIDALPPDTFTIKYYYPTTVTYAVTDGGVDWNGNEKNGAIFIKKGGTPLTLQANIKNYGNQTLGNFTALDTVRNMANVAITNGSAVVPPMNMQTDTVVTFSNTFVAPIAGTYKFNTAISGITGDMVASNNTMQQEIIAIDTSLTTMTLDYSDGIMDGGGLGWLGGNGGIGVYIEPPDYPVKIVSSRFYISANGLTPVGFYAIIYDDDGINGTPGTRLDSVYVPPTSITLNIYTTVPVSTPNLIVSSGGVYLLWYMAGPDINIARDLTLPISRQTYEVITGSWSEYRDKLTEDFLMGINVQYAVPVANFVYNSTNSPTVSFTDLSLGSPTSWFWDFDDGGINDTSSLQNPVYTFVTTGIHNVCLTATNSVGSSIPSCQNVSIVSVGNDEPITENSLKVFPNPFSDYTVISIPSTADCSTVTLVCYNLLGAKAEIIYQVSGQMIILKRGQLSRGSYLFEVFEKDNRIGQGKFVVQ